MTLNSYSAIPGFSYGLLHRIPAISEDQNMTEETQLDDTTTFVPADDVAEGYEAYDDHEQNEYGDSQNGDFERHYDNQEGDTHDQDERETQLGVANRNDYQRKGSMSAHTPDSPHYLDPPLHQPVRTPSPLHPGARRPASPPSSLFPAGRSGSPGAAFLHGDSSQSPRSDTM